LRASALVLFLSAAASADAQEPETRVEEWTRLRREKAASLAPPRTGFLERQLLAIEKATRPSLLDLNLAGFYPRGANVGSGAEWGLGTRFWQPDIGRSRVDVAGSVFYSINGYEFYDLQAGLLPHRAGHMPPYSVRGDTVYEIGDNPRLDRGHVSLYGSAVYRHYPQLDFYGLGGGTDPADHTNYLHQDARYEAVAGYHFRSGLAATVRGGFIQGFIGPGTNEDVPTIRTIFDDAAAPGLDEQPDFYRYGASIQVDTRDRPRNPHHGGLVALLAERYDERGGDAFTFDRLAADGRGFVSLGSPQRVLAVRAFVSRDRPKEGARVPFYLQESLGSGDNLRGFDRARFRGEKVLLLQAEYRWEAWPALEFALFADGGRAFRADEDFSVEDLEADYGFGVRLKSHESVLARLEVAFTPEGTALLVRLGPSF
jgi:hypothetical protein